MNLGDLVRLVAETPPFRGAEGLEAAAGAATSVTAVAYDSRQATAGAVFVALRGQHADGSAFVRDAITRGEAWTNEHGRVSTRHCLNLSQHGATPRSKQAEPAR